MVVVVIHLVMSDSCEPMDCSTPSFPVLHYLPEFAQTPVHQVKLLSISSCHPFSSYPQSLPASGSFPVSQLFSSGGQSIRASTSAPFLPMNIGLISFRMDWLDLFAAQGILKSLLQHHSSKASVLWCSVFFIVQLSHPYMTIGKNHSFDYVDFCQQGDVSAC